MRALGSIPSSIRPPRGGYLIEVFQAAGRSEGNGHHAPEGWDDQQPEPFSFWGSDTRASLGHRHSRLRASGQTTTGLVGCDQCSSTSPGSRVLGCEAARWERGIEHHLRPHRGADRRDRPDPRHAPQEVGGPQPRRWRIPRAVGLAHRAEHVPRKERGVLPRERGRPQVGFAITEKLREAIDLVTKKVWTPALDADGRIREGGDVAELTGLIDPAMLGTWPAGARDRAPRTAPSRCAAVAVRGTRQLALSSLRHQHQGRTTRLPRSPATGHAPESRTASATPRTPDSGASRRGSSTSTRPG